jgi:hypothetical protein
LLTADCRKLHENGNRMTTEHKIIDGDGHVIEDIATIWKYMPEPYVGRSFSDMRGRSPFPPIDHLRTANRHFTPKGAFVGVEGDEMTLPFAVNVIGNKPFSFSSPFPHEVNNDTSKSELDELDENPRLTKEDKDAVRYRNAERFYALPAN